MTGPRLAARATSHPRHRSGVTGDLTLTLATCNDLCDTRCMSQQTIEPGSVPEWDVADRMRKTLRTANLGVQEMADYLDVSRNTGLTDHCALHDDPTMPLPELLGTTEAAKRIDVDKATLTRWVASGRVVAATKLPKKNGAYLFTRDEVERIAAEVAAERAAEGVTA